MATVIPKDKKVVCVEIFQVRSVVELARMLDVSERALRREFKSREGTTLSKYITKARIERAKDLLLHSNLSCKEILLSAGFSRVESGYRAFKRVSGLTMGEFKSVAKNS